MSVSGSWHRPYLPTYGGPPPEEAIHVAFLERLPQETRAQVLDSLEDADMEWAKQFDEEPQTRQLMPVPWIRDWWPSSEAILRMASQEKTEHVISHRQYSSFILVDSGWDASTVVAAHHEWSDDGKRILVAVRVPMSIANLLLTLCDRGIVRNLIDALGEEEFERTKVDFYKDLPAPQPLLPEVPEYQPPAFLPGDLALSRSKLCILALQEFDEPTLSSVKAKIVGQRANHDQQPVDVQIINWTVVPPRRSELPRLFAWMDGNTPADDRQGYAFFVDYILEDSDGHPHILAASRTSPGGKELPSSQLSLLPVRTDKVIDMWKAAIAGNSEDEDLRDSHTVSAQAEIECAEIDIRERTVDVEHPIDFRNVECCPVFFLRNYTLDEERQIREALSELNDIEVENDFGQEYYYPGHIWPDGDSKRIRSLEDLRDLFEKCDPQSPFFDPSYSGLRIMSYPGNFVVVDDRALDKEKPQVILASSLDFYHPSNKLGWAYGMVAAKDAHLNWLNVDGANMGLSEMTEGGQTEKLWLSDLSVYATEDWKEDEGY